MDTTVIERMKAAGAPTTFESVYPFVQIAVEDDDKVVSLTDEIPVESTDYNHVVVTCKKISALFAGSKTPPSFSEGPTPEYKAFFVTIELAAANFCAVNGKLERDREFEELFQHLRRRPDGTHRNPLFSYLQAAVRVFMSLQDTSQAEFEAVVDRLRLSAKHFAMSASSTNYCETILDTFGLQLDEGHAVEYPFDETSNDDGFHDDDDDDDEADEDDEVHNDHDEHADGETSRAPTK